MQTFPGYRMVDHHLGECKASSGPPPYIWENNCRNKGVAKHAYWAGCGRCGYCCYNGWCSKNTSDNVSFQMIHHSFAKWLIWIFFSAAKVLRSLKRNYSNHISGFLCPGSWENPKTKGEKKRDVKLLFAAQKLILFSVSFINWIMTICCTILYESNINVFHLRDKGKGCCSFNTHSTQWPLGTWGPFEVYIGIAT